VARIRDPPSSPRLCSWHENDVSARGAIHKCRRAPGAAGLELGRRLEWVTVTSGLEPVFEAGLQARGTRSVGTGESTRSITQEQVVVLFADGMQVQRQESIEGRTRDDPLRVAADEQR